MAIAPIKVYDFKYFQMGFGFTLHKNDRRYKPRFIFACSRFLFRAKINDPYEQYKDAVGFLNYIFKENKNKPSRQEVGNIVSVAQLIKDGYEKYTRNTNELSISLNKQKVSSRWKEVYQVDKRAIQSKEALKKVDPSKRKGKKYFFDIDKKEKKETRTVPIRRMNTKLKELEKEFELLSGITRAQARSNPRYRNNMDKLDSLKWEIIRLKRTIENVDPNVISENEFDRVKIHMQREINQKMKMASYHDTDGKIKVGFEREEIDWERFNTGSFNRSKKHTNIK